MTADKVGTRFDVHEGSDCIVRYLPRPATLQERKIVRIVYGPVLYTIHFKWKEGGQNQYLLRLLKMGLIGGQPQ